MKYNENLNTPIIIYLSVKSFGNLRSPQSFIVVLPIHNSTGLFFIYFYHLSKIFNLLFIEIISYSYPHSMSLVSVIFTYNVTIKIYTTVISKFENQQLILGKKMDRHTGLVKNKQKKSKNIIII